MSKDKIKVRYNLGRGENYMKWKITYPDKTFEYRVPEEVELIMKNCFLRNQKGTADKIFKGSNKTVCAWIECDEITINPLNMGINSDQRLSYNPRVKPYWTLNGENVDSETFELIITHQRKIYLI